MVYRSERFIAGTQSTEAQRQPPSAVDQPGRQVHQLLNHRLQPTPLGRVANRGDLSEQSNEADPTQDVVGEGAHSQHQVIGVELARNLTDNRGLPPTGGGQRLPSSVLHPAVPLGKLPEGMVPLDAAAMTVVANVLLNLDEMFLKR